MKKITIYSMAILMLGIGTLNTGCMGSWAVSKKIYDWNKSVTGNKYLNNIIFWVLIFIPVYEFCFVVVDYWVLNTIEFWTGSNPLAMAPGEVESSIVKGKDGNQYQMTVSQNRYEAVALSGEQKGEKMSLIYSPESQTWSVEQKNQVIPVATIHTDINKVEVFGPNGEVQMLDMAAVSTQAMYNGNQ